MAGNGNDDGRLAVMRKVLSFEMTVAEWIGTAVILAVPYLAVGVVWALSTTDHLNGTAWVDRIVPILATIASWPALLVSGTYLT
jgi:hypothetical protein